MSTEDVLKQLQEKPSLGRFHYVVAKSLHQNEGVHFHVVLINYTKFDIRNETVLDLEYQGITYHGNSQSIKYYVRSVEYVCKDKEYITDMENLINGKICDDKEILWLQAQKIRYEKALFDYTIKNPKKALSSPNISSLRRNFRDMEDLENNIQDDLLDTPFTPENFNLQGALKEWNDNPAIHQNKALLLVGPSGIGKTSYAKTFCADHQLKTLIVNHKEDFKKINSSYDAIIIDDANVSQFEDTQILALLVNSAPKTLRVLYQTVRKKKGVTTIILMNHREFRKKGHLFIEDAFARRVVIFQPKQPFMINVKITHNTNNSFFNHHNTFQQHVDDDQQLIEDNRKRCREILNEDC